MSFVRYQFRRGTTAEWTSANPRLAPGEMGLAFPNNGNSVPQIKIGPLTDTSWNDINYLTLGSGGGDSSTANLGSGSVLLRSDTSGTNYSDVVNVRHAPAGDLSGHISIRGAVIPRIPNTFSLGLTGTRWRNIFVDTSGALNLGYTSLTDMSGQLEISGAIIPGSTTNTIGTATKPWSSIHIGASALTASGDNMIISTKDFFGYNDSLLTDICSQSINASRGEVQSINSISITTDGKKIMYVANSPFTSWGFGVIQADISGTQITNSKIVNIEHINNNLKRTIINAEMSRDGSTVIALTSFYDILSFMYVYSIYISDNSSTTPIIRGLTNYYGNASINIGFIPKKAIISGNGNVIVFIPDLNYPQSFIKIITKQNAVNSNQNNNDRFSQIDGIPNISNASIRYLNVSISDNGERIIVSYKYDGDNSVSSYLLYKDGIGYTCKRIITTPAYYTLSITPDGKRVIAGGTNNNTYFLLATVLSIGTITPTYDISWNNLPSITNKPWEYVQMNDYDNIIGVDNSLKLFYYNITTNILRELYQEVQSESSCIGITNLSDSFMIMAINRDVNQTKTNIYKLFKNTKIQTSAHIGIGTANPQARLEIANPMYMGESNALMLRNSGNAVSGQSVSMTFANSNDVSGTNAKILVDGSANAAMCFFTTTDGVLTEKFRIDNAGAILPNSTINAPLKIQSGLSGHPSVIQLESIIPSFSGTGLNGPSIDFYTKTSVNGTPYYQASIQGMDTGAGIPINSGMRFMVNKNGAPTELLKLTSNNGTMINTYTLSAFDDELLPGQNLTGDKYPFTLRFGNVYSPSIRSYYRNNAFTDSIDLQFLTSNGNTPDQIRMVIRGQAESGRIDMYSPVNIQRDMSPDSGGLVVQHTNGTQGIGIGYNTIYGNGLNQNLNIRANGAGIVKIDGISNISDRLSIGPDHNKTYSSYSGNITTNLSAIKTAPTFGGIGSARLVVDSNTTETYLRYGRWFEYPTKINFNGGSLTAASGGDAENTNFGMPSFGYENATAGGQPGSALLRKISIFGDSYIVASRGFAAFSDERVKRDIKPIEDNAALRMIRVIEPVEYSYIDKIENPHRGPIYGFIAQQVQKHFPDAVNTTDRYIPNIYNFKEYIIDASSNTLTIYDISDTIVDSTKPGDFIKCFDSSDNQFLFVIKDIVKPGIFICDISGVEKLPVIHDKLKTKIFCYGTHVSDFLTLEKDYLFTLNFAATQELDRTVQKQAAEITDLKAKNAELERKLAAVIAHLGINLN